MLSETDKAYLAGFFDGEGSISVITKTPWVDEPERAERYYPIIGVSQQDPAILYLLQEEFGGSKFYAESGQITFYGQRALAFLRTVVPYLCLKHTRAVLAIALLSATKAKFQLSDEERDLRKWIASKILMLNQKARDQRVTGRPYSERRI